jgi:predicted TIM-barrel fold metal-dependent hydrolase
VLEAHVRHPNVRGIRQLLNWHPDPAKSQCPRPDYLTDPRWQAGYALLDKYGLSFDLQVYSLQMHDAAVLAGTFANIPVIVNHTGLPRDRDPASLELWRRGLRELAHRPHVSIKISGLGVTDPEWTVDSLRPFVLETIDIFGVERCMFASNFPVDKAYRGFDELYEAFKTITRDFSAAERDALFGANAERVYRL